MAIIESPYALVAFDPDDPQAGDFLLALEHKFGADFLGAVSPGAVIVLLDPAAPDDTANYIFEESYGQGCPAQVGYPFLQR